MNSEKTVFFRQGTWMMATSTLSGIFMMAVHIVAARLPKGEYGLVGMLLQILNQFGIPAIGLQIVFAHQAAAARSAQEEHDLAATARGVLSSLFVLWLILAGLAACFQPGLMQAFKINTASVVWITLVLGLFQLWLPVGMGILQGRQNFFWMGLALLINGFGRFAAVAVILLVFHGLATGAMVGAAIGMGIAFILAFWQTDEVWLRRGGVFRWKEWLARVLPLSFGLGVSQFMLSIDMVYVRRYFPANATGLYAAAGTIGRGVVLFTVPLAAVMFPKIVQTLAHTGKSEWLRLTLISTAVCSAIAAGILTLFPKFPLMVWGRSYFQIAWLVPWFAWSMVPLTLANVIINHLLAVQSYKSVPWLVLVALGYASALYFFHASFLQVVQILGAFNLLLLLVAAGFSLAAAATREQIPGPWTPAA